MVLEKAVKYILSQSNVVAVSYGTRMAKLSETGIMEVPDLTRKRNRIETFNGWRELVQDDEKLVSRATMYKLIYHLTNYNDAARYFLKHTQNTQVVKNNNVCYDALKDYLCGRLYNRYNNNFASCKFPFNVYSCMQESTVHSLHRNTWTIYDTCCTI